jgi:hypothetical protein
MTKQLYRQGDVMFLRVDTLPPEATPLNTDIVAYGEATGHHHRIQGAQLLQLQNNKYAQVAERAVVVHEEHKPIELPAGMYRIIQPVEYNPVEMRRLAD